MGIDLQTKELLDPFDGQTDLKNQILRTPDPQFIEQDPLRLFRVMQFIGRFTMKPDKELNNICEKMDITSVSVERIEQEFYKLFLKSKRPSLGIRWLDEIGRLKEIMPELAATKTIAQELQWHPEGDVFEHSMQSVDAAAQMDYETAWNKLVLVYAALCHDLGKVSTTEIRNGKIISHGHAEEGMHLTKKMLKRVCRNKMLIETICKLVRYHMQPVQLVQGKAKPAAYKRLANKLAPQATLFMLAQLSLADRRGRNPDSHAPLTVRDPEVEIFLKKAEGLQVLAQVEAPLLLGRDLLNEVESGPQMGKLLKQAYEIQIEEDIKDKEELKRRVLKK
jgi:tRNA nucleotidyltransferase (CCA-adding enzyme)